MSWLSDHETSVVQVQLNTAWWKFILSHFHIWTFLSPPSFSSSSREWSFEPSHLVSATYTFANAILKLLQLVQKVIWWLASHHPLFLLFPLCSFVKWSRWLRILLLCSFAPLSSDLAKWSNWLLIILVLLCQKFWDLPGVILVCDDCDMSSDPIGFTSSSSSTAHL